MLDVPSKHVEIHINSEFNTWLFMDEGPQYEPCGTTDKHEVAYPPRR